MLLIGRLKLLWRKTRESLKLLTREDVVAKPSLPDATEKLRLNLAIWEATIRARPQSEFRTSLNQN